MIYTEAVKTTVKRSNGKAVLMLGFLQGERRSANAHLAPQVHMEAKIKSRLINLSGLVIQVFYSISFRDEVLHFLPWIKKIVYFPLDC